MFGFFIFAIELKKRCFCSCNIRGLKGRFDFPIFLYFFSDDVRLHSLEPPGRRSLFNYVYPKVTKTPKQPLFTSYAWLCIFCSKPFSTLNVPLPVRTAPHPPILEGYPPMHCLQLYLHQLSLPGCTDLQSDRNQWP